MPVFDTSCYKTKIKNVTDSPLYVSFLPPHGRTLDADEEFSLFGGLDAIASTTDRGSRERIFAQVERLLAAGWIEIIPPTPILRDVGDESVVMIESDGGTLDAVPACTTESL